MKKINSKHFIAVFTMLTIFSGSVLACVFLPMYFSKEPGLKPRMAGYYFADSIWFDDYDFEQGGLKNYTHILFAFAHISPDNGEGGLPYLTDGNIEKLKKLKAYMSVNMPDAKLLLSVADPNDKFSPATDSAEKRQRFADECVRLADTYGFDGLDVDWEYPEQDKNKRDAIHNFGDLLERLRDALGRDRLLSIAATPYIMAQPLYPTRRMAEILDFVNVMNYDYSDDNQADYNFTKKSLFDWVLCGFKKSQINMGLPFYARSENKKYLYKDFRFIDEMIKNGEATLYEKNSQSYAIARDGSKLSFDSKNQIAKKVKFVRDLDYGGVFCWHVSCDYSGVLAKTLRSGLFG